MSKDEYDDMMMAPDYSKVDQTEFMPTVVDIAPDKLQALLKAEEKPVKVTKIKK